MYSNKIDKLNFFIGKWDLEYQIPQTSFHDAMTDRGYGTFKKILGDKYLLFEYATQKTAAEAKGIFGWEEKLQTYRYYWFENSGNSLTANCHFINDDTLFVDWQDTSLIQTFTRETSDRIILSMEHPDGKGTYQNLLKVIMRRKQ